MFGLAATFWSKIKLGLTLGWVFGFDDEIQNAYEKQDLTVGMWTDVSP